MSLAPDGPRPTASLGRARLTVRCGPMARTLGGRFAAALAAETTLAVDRAQEAVLVAETIADHCSDLTPDGEMTVIADPTGDTLLIRVGPVERGQARQLLQADAELAGTVRALATRVEIRTLRSGRDLLVVEIGPHPVPEGAPVVVDDGSDG